MRDKLGNKLKKGDKLFWLEPSQTIVEVLEVSDGGLSLITQGGHRTMSPAVVTLQLKLGIPMDPEAVAAGAEPQLYGLIKIHDPEAQLTKDGNPKGTVQ